jgi:hypothetical protein
MSHALAARTFDRRLFAAAAIVFALIVLAGFGRTYYLKVFIGGPPLSSVLVFVHGLLMTAWVALFAAQIWLVSSRQVRLHQRLGFAGIGLAVMIVIVGFVTAIRAAKYGSPSTPPDVPPLAFLAVPLFDLVMFVLLFSAAIYHRQRPAAHKSLMLLTAINFLPPAVARIPITALRDLGPLWFFGLPAMLAFLCVALDWRWRGHVNRVLVTGSVLLMASYVVRLTVMGTGAWMQFAGWLTTFV